MLRRSWRACHGGRAGSRGIESCDTARRSSPSQSPSLEPARVGKGEKIHSFHCGFYEVLFGSMPRCIKNNCFGRICGGCTRKRIDLRQVLRMRQIVAESTPSVPQRVALAKFTKVRPASCARACNCIAVHCEVLETLLHPIPNPFPPLLPVVFAFHQCHLLTLAPSILACLK